LQHAHIGLAFENLQRFGAEARGHQHFDKLFANGFAQPRGRPRRLKAMMPPNAEVGSV
jgi:hypothetical protein